MNIPILRKILTELEKDDPSIDYLKGMVETLIEMGDPSPIITHKKHETEATIARTETVSDEDIIPAHLTIGPTASLNG